MSAIEFSNERSSENEMDWIRKTNAILSSKLSHHQRDDEKYYRDVIKTTHTHDDSTQKREKKNTSRVKCVLYRRTILF